MRNNIKALREMAHKTQDEMAAELGIKVSRLRSWEQGKRSPTGAMGIVLAEYFGVSTDTVFGSAFSDDMPLTSDETELLTAYRSLNEEGKSIALSTVNALAKSGNYDE